MQGSADSDRTDVRQLGGHRYTHRAEDAGMELTGAATQTCRTCGEMKPLTEFDVRADTGKRTTQCKACRRAYQNERNRLVPREPKPDRMVGTTELLTCTRCHELKPAEAFPRRRRDSEKLQSWCRDCFAELNARNYADNRDREIARIRRNTERGRQAARELVAAHLAAHPCVDCGETDPIVLEFDHVRAKRRDVSVMVAAGYPCATIEAEIAKCQVRCGNCHRRKTHERRMAEHMVHEERERWSLAA